MALRFFDTKPEAFALELAGTRSTYSGVCSAGRTGRNPHMCCAVYASLQLVAVHAEAYSRSNTNILHRRHARCACASTKQPPINRMSAPGAFQYLRASAAYAARRSPRSSEAEA